jgi:hypothetical protein
MSDLEQGADPTEGARHGSDPVHRPRHADLGRPHQPNPHSGRGDRPAGAVDPQHPAVALAHRPRHRGTARGPAQTVGEHRPGRPAADPQLRRRAAPRPPHTRRRRRRRRRRPPAARGPGPAGDAAVRRRRPAVAGPATASACHRIAAHRPAAIRRRTGARAGPRPPARRGTEAGAHLHIARAQDLTAIAVAAGHAAAEQADPAYRTELAAWTRAHRTLAAAGVDLADLTEMHPAA